jgi:hypothetical protein
MSHRRNLELLEYHLECAADIMDKEDIDYQYGSFLKIYITPTILIRMAFHVGNLRRRLI